MPNSASPLSGSRHDVAPPRSLLLARVAYPTVVVTAVLVALALLDAGAPAALATTAAYVFALVATLVLERIQPKDPAWSPASLREAATDLPYVLTGALVQRIVGGATVAGSTAVSVAFVTHAWAWPAALPMPVRAVLALLVADLGKYAVHRMSHERPWLWRFHAAHHAPDRMYALNALRLHPVNVAWNVGFEVGAAVLVGLDAQSLTIVGAFRAAVAVLQHANVALRLGWLDRILSTPTLHEYHHSAELAEANANYGATFSFWDALFGTLVVPADRVAPARLGLAEGGVQPRAFLHQLAWPWCEARANACPAVRGWQPDGRRGQRAPASTIASP